jgi:4,5-dihydroxyphthalate decarboxylase
VNDALTTPLVQHGVRANRAVLETAARYSHEQGLTPRVIPLEDVFAPSTIDL